MLAGLDEPDAGAVVKPPALTIGYLPQDGLNHTGRTLFEEAGLRLQAAARHARRRCTRSRSGSATTRCRRRSTTRCWRATATCRSASAAATATASTCKIATVLRGLGFAPDDMRQAERDLLRRLADAHRARQAAARPARACCCSTSRPTTSISTRATGSRNTSPATRTRSSWSRTTASSSTPSSPASPRSALRTLTDYVGNYSDYLARARRAHGAAAPGEARAGRGGRRGWRCSSTASATRRPRRRRCRAASRCSTRWCRSRCRPSASAIHFTFPACAKSGRTVLELKHVRKAYGEPRGLRRPQPAHRARRSHRAGRPQRRRQVDADAHAVRRGGARRRHADAKGHQVVMQYFAQDEATRLDPTLPSTRRWPAARRCTWCRAIRNILGGFLFSGDDVYKQVRVLSGGERTRLAVARMLLRPSNTLLLDEPTNHLDLDSKDVLLDALEDLRRHADLRLARSLLRRAARHQDHRDRRRRRAGLSGHLRGVPVEPGAAGGGRERAAGRARKPPAHAKRPEPAAGEAAAPGRSRPPRAAHRPQRRPGRPAPAAPAARRRRSRPTTSASGSRPTRRRDKKAARRAAQAHRRARGAHRRSRSAPSRRSRPRWPRPGFYDDRDAAAAGHRPAPGPDVGGRRPDAPVGSAADELVIGASS